MVGADNNTDHLMALNDSALQRIIGLLHILRVYEAVGFLPEKREDEMALIIFLQVIIGEREIELRILEISHGLHRERLLKACEEE